MFFLNPRAIVTIIQAIVAFCVVMFLLQLVLASPAFAGTDGTFNAAVTKLSSYINGSAGKLAALVALGYGVIRMATDGWSIGNVGVPVAVGLAAGIGGPIVQSTVTALI